MALSPQQCLLLGQCVALLNGNSLVIPLQALRCFLVAVVSSTPSIPLRRVDCFLAGELLETFATDTPGLYQADVLPAALCSFGLVFPASEWQELRSHLAAGAAKLASHAGSMKGGNRPEHFQFNTLELVCWGALQFVLSKFLVYQAKRKDNHSLSSRPNIFLRRLVGAILCFWQVVMTLAAARVRAFLLFQRHARAVERPWNP